MVGAEDGATSPSLVEAMARIIKGSQFHILEACGHIPCVEQPKAVASLIIDFMRRMGNPR